MAVRISSSLPATRAIFDPPFPPATVAAPPATISGSSREMVNGPIVCVEGGEATVVVAAAVYFTPSFPIPGVGTLTIQSLAADQKARKGKSRGKAVILKEAKFRARLQVSAPAQIITATGPVFDPTPVYSGTGRFLTTKTKARME